MLLMVIRSRLSLAFQLDNRMQSNAFQVFDGQLVAIVIGAVTAVDLLLSRNP